MDAKVVVAGISLVASNLALLPAIFYSKTLGLLPEFAILVVVFVTSTLYHLCQVGFVCVFGIDFKTFQFADHFFVYSALAWLMLYLFIPAENREGVYYVASTRRGLSLQGRIAIFIVIQAIVFPLLLEFVHRDWFVGVIIGIIVAVAIVLVVCVIRGIPGFNFINVLIAIVLIAVGFTLHLLGGDPFPPDSDPLDEDKALRYAWFHTAWHILIMLSIYYIIDLKYGTSLISRKFEYYTQIVYQRLGLRASNTVYLSAAVTTKKRNRKHHKTESKKIPVTTQVIINCTLPEDFSDGVVDELFR